MTKNDIISMALESNLLDSRDDLDHPTFAEILVSVERFYHLAVAAEREKTAKLFDNHNIWDEEVSILIRSQS